MVPQKLNLMLVSLLLCCSCSAYEFKSASELTLFKNYALSSCVATYYEGDSIYQDAIDALNGNRAYGNIPLDAYHEINDTLITWSKKEYVSKAGNISEFFMCIDFQNSKDVLEVYNKYDPCKSKESWTSEKEYDLRCNNFP